jgi:AcrR family transcriptional regulator
VDGTVKGRDAERTRTRLIAAAREIFAREGYRGATVRAITDAVGVNVGAVAYHFESKENLYHEVLKDVLLPLRERVLEACARDGAPQERLEAVIRAFFEHLLENPDQPRFMVGVRMDEERFPPAIVEVVWPVVQALVELMTEGQEKGFVREGPPMLFVLSLLSQPIYFSIVTQRAPHGILAFDPTSAEGRELLLDHMVRFALAGLRPNAAPGAPGSDGGEER